MKKYKGGSVAQGDVLIRQIDKLPDGLQEAKPEGGYHIVTHSETGHHHVVLERQAQMLIDRTNEFIAYLRVNEPCELKHLREHDTHESIEFPPGNYEIIRQRESAPQGWRRAAD